MRYYTTATKIVFPTEFEKRSDVWLAYMKIDEFKIDEGLLPANWSELTNDEKYDFLNEGGYWQSGFSDISDEQSAIIETMPECHGMHDEVCVSVMLSI
jgi:hypothetical protein